ncbi:acyltransferase [Alkalimonas amylolytica]|uniref:Hexapeptide repeat of succinyl-transferase n=1 Tax=Alkalimonas amylolytica TaxID=152573 RepID=A0A1H4CCK4_ALKAM|nr:acyltransferase [Alkalimonas amylolytica]SEA57822.1 Hexapeptide repeat of succinyl-transferase [Alkalimonas amylolytica]
MKSAAKAAVRLLMLLLVSPLLLLYFLLRPVCARDSLFSGFAQLLSLWPGLLGSYLRVAAYRLTMQHCAADCYIGFGALFSQQGTEIQEGVYIGPQCNIGLCRIGENTLLGSGVHILSGKNQHHFADPSTPYKDQGGRFEKVQIGTNCWIGNGAIVMASIGDGCIIGAGAVVTEDLPAGVIAVGNPARIVRKVAELQTKPTMDASI